jgi:bifunctional UDP-N-acetylglucosamine pyrophosphorylase/glucosamine-1-phosphate N-acetyltransferase
VGDGAYTAAGSVITEDVPPGALGVARGQQRNVEGWVERKRPGSAAADAARRAREGAGGEGECGAESGDGGADSGDGGERDSSDGGERDSSAGSGAGAAG